MLPQPTASRSLETAPFLPEHRRPLKAEWQAEVRKAPCTRRANGKRPASCNDEGEVTAPWLVMLGPWQCF